MLVLAEATTWPQVAETAIWAVVIIAVYWFLFGRD